MVSVRSVALRVFGRLRIENEPTLKFKEMMVFFIRCMRILVRNYSRTGEPV